MPDSSQFPQNLAQYGRILGKVIGIWRFVLESGDGAEHRWILADQFQIPAVLLESDDQIPKFGDL